MALIQERGSSAQAPGLTRCKCGAHSQHKVFRYKWSNPAASRADIAKELHMTLSNVKKTLQRLRHLDLLKRCPECFDPKLFDGVCQSCGFEPASAMAPFDVHYNFDQQSPSNSLHPGNELGSDLNYHSVGFTNHGTIVQRWIEGSIEDSLIRGVKSDVMNELKRYYPTEVITDYAGKLCVKEVCEFRANYPVLAVSKNVRKQLAIRVMKRLEFLYPVLARPHYTGGDRGT